MVKVVEVGPQKAAAACWKKFWLFQQHSTWQKLKTNKQTTIYTMAFVTDAETLHSLDSLMPF